MLSVSPSFYYGGFFDWDNALLKLEELNALSEDPDLWNDADKAQKLMKERNGLAAKIDMVRGIEQELQDNIELIELAEMEGDQSVLNEAESALKSLKDQTDRQQLHNLLSGEADHCSAYLEINAGAGGTESQDWASMLMRQYMRWAQRKGYVLSVMDRHDGEEAGIKSVSLKIEGDMAYGWLRAENGVHRLVRISPFDSNAKRHTSFASISVSPVIDDTIEVVVEDKDLRIDTYRSQGAGGQHVNTTDSAVRITHIPTGIVAACQSGRSQHQNKDLAMSMLRARLYEAEVQRREQEKAKAHGMKTDIGWGHQIRSYVLHPYQMVKDLRTNFETSNTSGVMDGDIDGFLEAYLSFMQGNASES
jgi:peptide chain release factor 2